MNGDANVTGNYISNGIVIIQNTRTLVNINSIDFHAPSLLYETTFRLSTISLCDGIAIFDTQCSTNSIPNINLRMTIILHRFSWKCVGIWILIEQVWLQMVSHFKLDIEMV